MKKRYWVVVSLLTIPILSVYAYRLIPVKNVTTPETPIKQTVYKGYQKTLGSSTDASDRETTAPSTAIEGIQGQSNQPPATQPTTSVPAQETVVSEPVVIEEPKVCSQRLYDSWQDRYESYKDLYRVELAALEVRHKTRKDNIHGSYADRGTVYSGSYQAAMDAENVRHANEVTRYEDETVDKFLELEAKKPPYC